VILTLALAWPAHSAADVRISGDNTAGRDPTTTAVRPWAGTCGLATTGPPTRA
jgi:hypothetical protein